MNPYVHTAAACVEVGGVAQHLALNGTVLSISGGNSVDLRDLTATPTDVRLVDVFGQPINPSNCT